MEDKSNLEFTFSLDTSQFEKGAGIVIDALRKISNAFDEAINKQNDLKDGLSKKNIAANTQAATDMITSSLKTLSSVTGTTGDIVNNIISQISMVGKTIASGASSGMVAGSVLISFVNILGQIVVSRLNEMREAEENRKKVFEDSISNTQSYIKELSTVENSVKIMSNSTSTIDEMAQARNNLGSVINSLIISYDEEGNAILANNTAIEQQIELLKYKIELNRIASALGLSDAKDEYDKKLKEVQNKEKEVERAEAYLNTQNDIVDKSKAAGSQLINYANLYAAQEDFTNKSQDLVGLQLELIPLQENVMASFVSSVQRHIDGFGNLSLAQQASITSMILSTEDLEYTETNALALAQEITDKLASGDFTTLSDGYIQINESAKSATEALKELSSAASTNASDAESSITNQISALQSLSNAYQTLQEGGTLSADTLHSLSSIFPEISTLLETQTSLTLADSNVMRDAFENRLRCFETERIARINSLESQRDSLKKSIAMIEEEARTYDVLSSSVLQAEYAKKVSSAEKTLSEVEQAIANLKATPNITSNISLYGSGSNQKKSSGSSKNEALQKEIKLLEQKKKMDQVTSEEELAWLERMLGQYRMSAEERQDLEYRIYQVKKKLQDEEEKRLQQQIKQLDELGSAVTSALKARYEEQKEIEQKRIDDSIQSWKNWEEQTVAAIQGQIDALDELEKEQESADKRAEYERSKQALELQKAYEKDLYQREMIQKEINRLDKEEQKRLEQEARDELRKQLEQQIEDAKEQSKQKQEALEKESEALDETYEKLMQDSALKAEAERMLMQASQEDILQLLQSYAPDYEVVGQSMGERLVEGFTQKVGSLEDYFNRVQARIDAFHAAVADNANQAADHFYASRAEEEARIAAQAAPTNIQMTVNFNQPVESPIETRRELEKAMQSMVVKIQQGG